MSPISLLATIGKPHFVEGGAELARAAEHVVDHLKDLATRFAIGGSAIQPLDIDRISVMND
jgi:hypothetical protein